jgi:PPOX class probable F420-dependent enzyme
MTSLTQFAKQKYLNLETFRKNGLGVKTPVWFVQDGEILYVITMAGSGKVKRIRRDEHVNVAACRMDGKVTGTWVRAQARQVADPEIREKVDRLLGRKYGLLKKLFERQRADRGSQDTVLEIMLEG